MKILYVVSRPLEINTSSSIRNRATIEGMLKLGYEVDLVTTEPDKGHSNYDNSISLPNLNTYYLKSGRIQNVVKFGRKLKIMKWLKKKAYDYMVKTEVYDNLKGIVNQIPILKVNDSDYDLIISSSDPKSSHLFISVMYEKSLLNLTPWIQIWGDPFLSDITRGKSKLDKKIKKEEIRLLKYASKIVYVSRLTLNEQKVLYPQYTNKMFYEPVPYIKEEVYPEIDYSKESLTYLYCGDYSSSVRDITNLYKAINNTKHKLIICGHSDLDLKSTERIKIYPRVSFSKVKEFEKKCDVLVHLSNLSGTQIPGKIYQYSGTNKPILFILDGEKELLKETFGVYDRYIFADNSKEDLINKINDISSGIYRGATFIEKSFSPIKVASKILQLDCVE